MTTLKNPNFNHDMVDTPNNETIIIGDGAAVLRLGDCLNVMAAIPAASVDAIVTDPPYGLGFMGKDWDHGVPGEAFWREALRVAKPGAHLLAFGGSRTFHRLACTIEDAGWEIRDTLMWLYGSGFPKSLDMSKAIDKHLGVEQNRKITHFKKQGPRSMFDGGKPRLASLPASQWQGYGTALKPAFEPIILARKPLTNGSIAANLLAHGCGALNIDACRVDVQNDLTARKQGNAPKSNGISLGLNWHGCVITGGHPLGRFPSNLLHDGSDDVLTAFPNAKTARFFYSTKATVDDREAGLEYERLALASEMTGGRAEGSAGLDSPRAGADRRAGGKNFHPTVKPTNLMRWLVRLITPPGGIILDPFMGSGSTGRGALLEGFHFEGIEIDADYIALAAARIENALSQPDLFNQPSLKASPMQTHLFDEAAT